MHLNILTTDQMSDLILELNLAAQIVVVKRQLLRVKMISRKFSKNTEILRN